MYGSKVKELKVESWKLAKEFELNAVEGLESKGSGQQWDDIQVKN